MTTRWMRQGNDEDKRDERWVTIYDDEAVKLMSGWTGGQSDPLYAISSSGGGNYAWVIQDALANINSDLAKVKKLGRNKYQFGRGTFTKAEIDELHTIQNALESALDDPDSYSSPESEEVREGESRVVRDSKALLDARAKLAAVGMAIKKTDGEYRVYPKGNRDPDIGHFTDDLDDAVATGLDMAARGFGGKVGEGQVVADFPSVIDALEGAQRDGATQVLLPSPENADTYVFFPNGSSFLKVKVFEKHGKWHVGARDTGKESAFPRYSRPIGDAIFELRGNGSRVEAKRKPQRYVPRTHYTQQQLDSFIIDDLVSDLNAANRDFPNGQPNDPGWAPYIADLERSIASKKATFRAAYGVEWTSSREPDLGESHMVRDYIAVDPGGRVVGGPFKDYSEAKARASKAGGYVQFAMGENQLREHDRWQVIVGNIGTVFDGTRESAARVVYKDYVIQSKSGNGRAAHEDVTLMKNGEPVAGFVPRRSMRETTRRKRTPINGAKGVRIETEEHRRQYAAERASEDYYEAWMEAAGDWATRSELIDAWLVDHPEVVVGAWIDTSGIREMNATRRKRTPTSKQAGAQYAQDQIEGDYFKQWIFDQMIEAKAMAKRDPSSVMPLETKADYRKLARNMLQQLTWDTKRDLNESKEFFEGFTEELKKDTTIDWLADELKSIHNHLHGKLDESRVQARPSKRSTDDRKAAWMRAFQDAATALGAVGKLVWQDAEYLYSQGVDSLTAARRIYGPRSSKPGDLQASRAPLALPSGPVRHRRRIGQKPLSARRRAR